MCGRYASYTPPDAIRRLVRAVNVAPNFEATWNLAPSQAGLVVRRHPETGERHLDALQWGFIPHWATDLKAARKPINARTETLGTTPMFREAAAARRCLVPADAFYEWQRTNGAKQPYAIARRDGEPMLFAGVWDGWRGQDGQIIRSYAIVTCPANATLAPLHDRMPAIIEPEDWPAWLGEVPGDPLTLLRPAGGDILRAWRVSPEVNSVHHNGAALLVPV